MSAPTKYSYFTDDEVLRLVRQYNYNVDRDMVIELTYRLHLALDILEDADLVLSRMRSTNMLGVQP